MHVLSPTRMVIPHKVQENNYHSCNYTRNSQKWKEKEHTHAPTHFFLWNSKH